MTRTQTTLSILALAASLTTACGTTPPPPTVDPEPETQIEPEPEEPDAQARADFNAAYAAYARAEADGELSESECSALTTQFNEVFAKHPKSMIVARFNAGVIHESCGQLDEAVAIYTQLADAGFHLALNNLGVIEWERGNVEAALALFDRSVKADEVQAFAARNNLAAVHRDRYASKRSAKDFATAEKEIQNVLAVDTSNKAAYENLARLYYDRGRLEDSSYLVLANLVVTQAMRVLDKDGQRSAALWNLEGLLFMEDDNQVDALKAFKKAVEIDPVHPDANRNIGFIAIRFRDYAGAVTAFDLALRDTAVKRDVEVYLAMGVAKRGLGEYDEAESWYRKAMDIDKRDPRPWYNLAVLNQDHLIGASEVDVEQIKAFYKIAKDHCAKFATMAEGDKRYASAIEDCLDRMAIVDDALYTFDEMDRLEQEAERLRILEQGRELERREELRKLEEQALAAGQPSPSVLAEEAEAAAQSPQG